MVRSAAETYLRRSPRADLGAGRYNRRAVKRVRRVLAELLFSALLHAALLAAFGAPLAMERLAKAKDAPPPPSRSDSQRSPHRDRPARKDAAAARRLDRDLPRVRAETPPEQRKLVILPMGAGLADHDAHATGGMPGIVRPASAEGPLGKRVLLPSFEPDQLENPKTSEVRSSRRDAERSPLQRPELDPGFGLFASVLSSGRYQTDPGRPSAAQVQVQAQQETASALPKAQPSPETPASSALPPPPNAELAKPQEATQREKAEELAAPTPQAQQPKGVDQPKKPDSAEPKEQRVERASSPFERRDPRLAMVVTAAKKSHDKPLERPDHTMKAEAPKKAEPQPKEQLAQKGQEKIEEVKADLEREQKSAEERRKSPPKTENEEASVAAADSKLSGLWLAEGRAQEKREESGAKDSTPKPLAEAKPREQPVQLAMAAAPKAPGAGDEAARRAQMASPFTPQPRDAPLTSFEEKLKVDSFEGGEEGARQSDQSGRTLAAAERKLVGSETVEGHKDGVPVAGRIVVAPEGDGSGDEEGMASVAGRAELRHLVQERVNHVASLVGPGLVARTGKRGVAIVKFKVDFTGYVRAVKLERSTGSQELDEEIETVVRLAEPYTGWLGWMRVAVSFGTPMLDL